MTAAPGPVARWAAAHAATMTARGPSARRADVSAPARPAPVRFASVTQIREWQTGDVWVASIALARVPDGRVLAATGGSDSVARIWDARTGTLLETLTGHSSPIRGVAWGFGADGQPLLATGASDTTVRVWRPFTGETARVLTGLNTQVNSVAWGYRRGGQGLLAASDYEGELRAWDPATGEPEQVGPAGDALVTSRLGDVLLSVSIGYQSGGQPMLAACGYPHGVTVRELAGGRDSHATSGPGPAATSTSVAWSYQPGLGPAFASCSDDGLRLWTEHGGEYTATVLTEQSSYSAAWAPLYDGRCLLATFTKQALLLWDAHTMSLVYQEPSESGRQAFDELDWITDEDGRLLLASVTTGGQVVVRDVVLDPAPLPGPGAPRARGDRWPGDGGRAARPRPSPGAGRPAPPLHGAEIVETRSWAAGSGANGVDLTVTADGQPLLAVGEHDGTVRILDAGTGQTLRTLTGHTGGPVYTVAWGSGGVGHRLLASGGQDGVTRVWNPGSGEQLHALRHDGVGLIEQVAWGSVPGTESLIAAAAAGVICVWDIRTGNLVHRLTTSARRIFQVSWGRGSDGEARLAVASQAVTDAQGSVQLWEAGSGQLRQVLAQADSTPRPTRAATWQPRPDGRAVLATLSVGEAVLRLWTEAEDGAFTAEDHDPGLGVPYTLAWIPLPDGRLLLAGGTDHTLFLLDGTTLEPLLTTASDSTAQGLHNLAGAVTPDGRVLLAASADDGLVHVRTVELDPPVAAAAPAGTGEFLDSPQDVTPAFHDANPPAGMRNVRCATGPDGHVLLADSDSDSDSDSDTGGSVRIWDATTGALLRVLPMSPSTPSTAAAAGYFSWGHLADGQLVLATMRVTDTSPQARPQRTGDPGLQIWNPGTGELLYSHSGYDERRLGTVTWIDDADGRPLIAVGAAQETGNWIWDPVTGEVLRTLVSDRDYIYTDTALTHGRLSDGRYCVVTGGWTAPARVWDLATGELIHGFPSTRGPGSSHSAAWGHGPDGRPELAIGGGDSDITIWDAETWQLRRTLAGHHGPVYSLAWSELPGLPPALVSRGRDRTVRIWDPLTGVELGQVPGPDGRGFKSVDLIRGPDGDLLLFVAADEEGRRGPPARVYRIASGPAAPPAAGPGHSLAASEIEASAGRLLLLGRGGLWPPLGLLTDLITLTSADPTPRSGAQPLNDPRLAALDAEAGLGRLRELAGRTPPWRADARAAFAALLTSGLDIPAAYAPPPDASPGQLRAALADALTFPPAAGASWPAPLPDLRAAFDAVTGQTAALLAILGPDACAADPLLPLRLAHHAPQLPVLSQPELRLLTAAGAGQPASGAAATGTTTWAPGTAGLARSGPPPRLLPTQLALPPALFAIRLAEDQLLYRQHRAPAPPAPEPVTIILDTTPATFGPAGNCLRLAAHLLTLRLWEHGRYPLLVTLADPGSVRELRSPADLIALWTSATLEAPAARLAAARRTAAQAGQPVVLCTHFQTALECGYRAGPASRLLTSHQPPEKPRGQPAPAGRWHAHLPPGPPPAQLSAAIAVLLAPGAGHGG